MANIDVVLDPNDQYECARIGPCLTDWRVGETFTQQQDFATKVDAPCNYDDCPCNLSVSGWVYDDHIVSIAPGQTVSWMWTNPADTANNYLGSKSCLFNFNNVSLFNTNDPGDTTNATGDDVKFSVRVNNGNSVDYYHTKVYGHHMSWC
jgi:hypothetical protein